MTAISPLAVFGGRCETPPCNETFSWDGTAWSSLCPGPGCSTAPPARSEYGMARFDDGVEDYVLMYGGSGETSTLGDTWRWNGSNWTQLTPALGPDGPVPNLSAHSMASSLHDGTVDLWCLRPGAPKGFHPIERA
ncbi:MAG: hypothetical protein AAF654_13935 [Myxococcota bacterium]